MDQERCRDRLSRIHELTAARREEAAAVLSNPSEGAALPATIELGVDDQRLCPHCGAGGAASRGKARGLRRLRCKECGGTFGALMGTALPGLYRKERWLAFGEALAKGGDDQGVCRVLRGRAEHDVSPAPPFPDGGRADA